MEITERTQLVGDLDGRNGKPNPDQRNLPPCEHENEGCYQIELPFERQTPSGRIECKLRERKDGIADGTVQHREMRKSVRQQEFMIGMRKVREKLLDMVGARSVRPSHASECGGMNVVRKKPDDARDGEQRENPHETPDEISTIRFRSLDDQMRDHESADDDEHEHSEKTHLDENRTEASRVQIGSLDEMTNNDGPGEPATKSFDGSKFLHGRPSKSVEIVKDQGRF
ncbi:MAG: hypothetical protein JOZ30_09590 [Hyphomicrobiales bacterium]|nr:hypothetical protein [Hyphomicrobiales bacterium]